MEVKKNTIKQLTTLLKKLIKPKVYRIAKEFRHLRIIWFELKVNSRLIRNLIKFNADDFN